MDLRRYGKRNYAAPRVPFYKDERIIGKRITVSVSLRVLLLAIVMFAVAVGFTMFQIIDTQANFHKYIVKSHASRLTDQAQTDQKIAQLGCYILANAPDNPKVPLIAKARRQYNCPPYGQDPNFVNPKTGAVGPIAPVHSPSVTPKPSLATQDGPAEAQAPQGATRHHAAAPAPVRTITLKATPGASDPTSVPHKTQATSPTLTVPPLIGLNEKTCFLAVLGVCLVK